MSLGYVALLVSALCSPQVRVLGSEDTYKAVVVEYSPSMNPSLDPDTNILNNVKNYVDIVNTAGGTQLADIIVFPEAGLRGYTNPEKYLVIPDPADRIVPCAHSTIFEPPLVQLSCSARSTATYIVVNLDEMYYNNSLHRIQKFNTDVVFDLHGAIIARYRKIHLFGEGDKESPGDRNLVYFDTEFGVRFGVFTCFDIIFQDPSVELAKTYNISHFVFLSAWFSEMPFLTAIQEQSYWSYTMNAVLLASGYNMPSWGSSGSGIYLGRQGPSTYILSETRGSYVLYADIPKNISSLGSAPGYRATNFEGAVQKQKVKSFEENTDLSNSSPGIQMKRDFLDVYATEPIIIPITAAMTFNGSDVMIPFAVETTVCHNSICCEFSLKITSVFSETAQKITRGDDYSKLYFRMAAFDGVRNYEHFATGGLQTCALIPCITKDLSSCGLRSDDPSAQPNTLANLYQKKLIFDSITISGVFSKNSSFVGPNVLLGGEGDRFGSLLGPGTFVFYTSNKTEEVSNTFQTVQPVENLVLASLYGRIFNRDGLPYTGSTPEYTGSSGYNTYINLLLLLLSIIMIKYSNYT